MEITIDLLSFLFIIFIIALEYYKFKEWKEARLNMAVFALLAYALLMVKVPEIRAQFLIHIVYAVTICLGFCIIVPKLFPEKGNKEPPTYDKILQVIHDTGKEFERHPVTYRDENEEDLRNHLLSPLESLFKGSATGETINNKGKTDILIRHENINVFIAECKCWRGRKYYLDAITQLLGYLTWRDTEAAVVIFVRKKDILSVLQIIEEETPNHSNYLRFVDKREESWFNYRFHIMDNPNREIKLSVLLFHIPS